MSPVAGAIPAVLDVQSRIAAIQQRFGARPAGVPAGTLGAGVSAGVGGGALAADGPGFAADLTAAQLARSAQGSGGIRGIGGNGGSATGSVTGAEVLAAGESYLGVPYRWGGMDPATGLDCSGLTQLVFAKFGIDLPRVSWQQAKEGRPVAGLAGARPGDLLFFGSPVHHVGIYAGDNRMLEAPRPGKNVRIAEITESPSAVRRVLPDTGGPALATLSGGTTPGAVLPAGTTPSASLSGGTTSSAVLPAGTTPSASLSGGTTSSAVLPAGTTPSASLLPALAAYAGPVGNVPYAAAFTAAEQRYGVPARVLAAVAKAESGYRTDATSGAGARGLMQLMPATAKSLGVDATDPAQAIDGAARLLARHVREFGSLDLAVAAYNAGDGAVRRFGGIPPYPETTGYVARIMSALTRST